MTRRSCHDGRGFGAAAGALATAFVALIAAVLILPLKALAVAAVFVAVSLGIGGVIAGVRSSNRGSGFWDGLGRFITDNWSSSVALGMGLSLVSFGVGKAAAWIAKASAKKKLASGVKQSSIHDIQIIDANDVQTFFTPEAWATKQGLGKNMAGETVSSMANGRAIHRGFMKYHGQSTKLLGGNKKGGGLLDGLHDGAIWELKANNAKQIALGKKQLLRYQKMYFTERQEWLKMILVLY